MSTAIISNAVENKEGPLSLPFPRWINRWVIVLMLVFISVPVFFLLFLQQPVYSTEPAYPVKVKDKIMLTATLPATGAEHHAAGEQVGIAMDAAATGLPSNIKGRIYSVDNNDNGMQLVVEAEPLLQARLNRLPTMQWPLLRASVQFSDGSRNILQKIFGR